MAGTKTRNTMAEVLQQMLQDLAQAKTLPDADLEFVLNLETVILTKLRQPMEQMMGQLEGAVPPGGAPPSGAEGGALPPGAIPLQGIDPSKISVTGAPVSAPPRVPGIMNGPNLPNPDELRRMLTQ